MTDPIDELLLKTEGPAIPECCRKCRHYESEYSGWSDCWFRFCNLNLRFPTKKLSCKRQNWRRRE